MAQGFCLKHCLLCCAVLQAIKMGQAVYSQPGAAGAAAGPGAAGGAGSPGPDGNKEGPAGDDVIDAEFSDKK